MLDAIEYSRYANDTELVTQLRYDDGTLVKSGEQFRIYTIGQSGKKIYFYKASGDHFVRASFKQEGEYDKEKERSLFSQSMKLPRGILIQSWINSYIVNGKEPHFASWGGDDYPYISTVKGHNNIYWLLEGPSWEGYVMTYYVDNRYHRVYYKDRVGCHFKLEKA